MFSEDEAEDYPNVLYCIVLAFNVQIVKTLFGYFHFKFKYLSDIASFLVSTDERNVKTFFLWFLEEFLLVSAVTISSAITS